MPGRGFASWSRTWEKIWDGGSPAERRAAIDAFEGSRDWPLLQDIAGEGRYSSGFWSIAGELRAGHTDKGPPLTAHDLEAAICS